MGMAWYRAIWGIELADAEKNAQEAVNIIHALKPEADILTVSYVEDTLGYILLQMGRPQDARKRLEIASRAKENPGATFRYALALHILGQESEAEQNLKKAIIDGGYWPSHELLLLRQHFNKSDGFMTTFANLIEKPQALTRPACWKN
jgi:predicted Zn-dependent protease